MSCTGLCMQRMPEDSSSQPVGQIGVVPSSGHLHIDVAHGVSLHDA